MAKNAPTTLRVNSNDSLYVGALLRHAGLQAVKTFDVTVDPDTQVITLVPVFVDAEA